MTMRLILILLLLMPMLSDSESLAQSVTHGSCSPVIVRSSGVFTMNCGKTSPELLKLLTQLNALQKTLKPQKMDEIIQTLNLSIIPKLTRIDTNTTETRDDVREIRQRLEALEVGLLRKIDEASRNPQQASTILSSIQVTSNDPRARMFEARRQLAQMGRRADSEGFLEALSEPDPILLPLYAEAGIKVQSVVISNNFDKLEALAPSILLTMAEQQAVTPVDSPNDAMGSLRYTACGISWSNDADFRSVERIIGTHNTGLAKLMRNLCDVPSVRERWLSALKAGEDNLALISDAQGHFSVQQCIYNYTPFHGPIRDRVNAINRTMILVSAHPKVIPETGGDLTFFEAKRLREADPNFVVARRATAVRQSCPALAEGHTRLRKLLDSARAMIATWSTPNS